jgi:hypothetical protein
MTQAERVRRRFFVALATVFVAVGGCAVVAVGAQATAACSALRLAHARVDSHAFFTATVQHGRVGCATTRYVLSKVLGGAGVKHGGPYAYQESWTLDGWRCGFGAGAVGCSRGNDSIDAEWLAYECGYEPEEATAPCISVPSPVESWATIDECSVTGPPFVVGIRSWMQGDEDPQTTMHMRFRLQFLDRSRGVWTTLPGGTSPFINVAYPMTGGQAGRTFEVTPSGNGSSELRGLVEFQWRIGRTLLFTQAAATTPGCEPEAGAEPPGFSASACSIP